MLLGLQYALGTPPNHVGSQSTHGADILGAAVLSLWDFLPKVPVNLFMFLGKGEHRSEVFSGDN